MRASLSWIVVVLASTVPALAAQPLDDSSLPGTNRYDRCLSLVQHNASDAYDAATAWQNAAGGAAAAHCAALALVSLRRYGEAGAKLDQLAQSTAVSGAAQRAELLDQAGNAWLLAGRPADADASFTSALTLVPGDPDILADRARANGARKDWAGADRDLTAVLAADPERADILVLRASARHALGRKVEARADIDSALTVYRDYPEALVERGELKAEAGDPAGALADWQRVLSVAPNGDAAQAARQHIAQAQAPAQPIAAAPKK
jgi:regulator of sirC expression with transglutaminase-like and TPR domain